MADSAVADVSLLWLLNALNSLESVPKEMLQSSDRHPELLWRELAWLAGSLLTSSLEDDVSAAPPYQHANLQRIFPPLFALLAELLEASLPSRAVATELTQERQFWYGALSDARLREGTDFYLSVRPGLPVRVFLAQFPQLCEVRSRTDVSDVVNTALSDIPLKSLIHIPAAIPLRLGNQYFALEINHPVAQVMLDAGNCVFYVPRTLGEIQPELFAILRD